MFSLALICSLFAAISQIAAIKPQLPVIPTRGAIFPKPASVQFNDTFLIIRPQMFRFKVDQYDCDIVQSALDRYYKLIFPHSRTRSRPRSGVFVSNFAGYLDTFHIHLMQPCERYPSEFMDEQYEIRVNTVGFLQSGILIAHSVWGILRGLESFSHLITDNEGYPYTIPTVFVLDSPRFPHRGLLIDTSRHFLPVPLITKILQGMECNKLNVLHWHIVDDQSFPYQSEIFPSLSEAGAYNPETAIYTHTDIRQIVEFARLRGIRVIPEFDTPGHTLSWGYGMPGLLTKCANVAEDGEYGPVDPSREENYKFFQKFFVEVTELFPDLYIHLGGDEVDPNCWASNRGVVEFMRRLNISGNYNILEEYHISRLTNIIAKVGVSPIVWQEVFDNGVRLSNNTIVQIWTGSMADELHYITKAGFKTLLSTCWYLDHLNTGGDWVRLYECDPLDFPGTDAQKRLVIGGEACMWGEVVDESNVQQRIWPRSSAVAEVLWSHIHSSNRFSSYVTNDIFQRLEEHACRMKKRGIPTQPPNGPGFCPYVVSF